MPRKPKQQNIVTDVVPKKAPSKKVRKHKPTPASPQQIRRLVQRRFEKQKEGKGKKNKAIPPNLVKKCLEASHFNCSICLDLLVYPTSLFCGHSFCLACIQKLNKTQMKYKCSLCRQPDLTDFYQVDKIVQNFLLYVQVYKLNPKEMDEYRARKEQMRREISGRGFTVNLNVNDQIKIKVKNTWQLGRIVSVKQIGTNRFYTVQIGLSADTYCLPSRSINIGPTDDYLKRSKQQSRGIFSQNIFIQNYVPHTINNTYNIEELLWEVNYYPPMDREPDGWDFSLERAPSEYDVDSDSDSVQFLGRSLFGRNMREPINID